MSGPLQVGIKCQIRSTSCWFTTVAFVFSRPRVRGRLIARVSKWIERSFGTVLIGIWAWFLAARDPGSPAHAE